MKNTAVESSKGGKELSLYGKFIRRITLLLSVILLMLAVQHISVKADYDQGYPNPTEKKYVNDYAGVIDEATEQYIVNAGEELEQKTGAQAVVVVINSLQGNNLESYATGLFNEWGIGQQDKNNGLLILVAINDRRWRVEVGKGLENVISNTNSASTMEELAKPYFKESNYEEGIKAAYSFFAQTIAKSNNVTLNNVKNVKLHGKTILGFSPVIFMILLFVILAGIFYSSRKRRIGQRGNYYSDSNYYHNNFWGNDDSGSSDSGFGGGSSDGGGSSGGW